MSSSLPSVPFQVFNWNDPELIATAQATQKAHFSNRPPHPIENFHLLPLSMGYSVMPERILSDTTLEAILATVRDIYARTLPMPPLPPSLLLATPSVSQPPISSKEPAAAAASLPSMVAAKPSSELASSSQAPNPPPSPALNETSLTSPLPLLPLTVAIPSQEPSPSLDCPVAVAVSAAPLPSRVESPAPDLSLRIDRNAQVPSPPPAPSAFTAAHSPVPVPIPILHVATTPKPVKLPVPITEAQHRQMMEKQGLPVLKRYGIFRAILDTPSQDRRAPLAPQKNFAAADLSVEEQTILASFKASFNLPEFNRPPRRFTSRLVQEKLRAMDDIVKSWVDLKHFPEILENTDKWEKTDFVQFFLSLQENLSSFLVASSNPYCTHEKALLASQLALGKKQIAPLNSLNSWRKWINICILNSLEPSLKTLSDQQRSFIHLFIQGCLNYSDDSFVSEKAFESLSEEMLKNLNVVFQTMFFGLVRTIKKEKTEFTRLLGKK